MVIHLLLVTPATIGSVVSILDMLWRLVFGR